MYVLSYCIIKRYFQLSLMLTKSLWVHFACNLKLMNHCYLVISSLSWHIIKPHKLQFPWHVWLQLVPGTNFYGTVSIRLEKKNFKKCRVVRVMSKLVFSLESLLTIRINSFKCLSSTWSMHLSICCIFFVVVSLWILY